MVDNSIEQRHLEEIIILACELSHAETNQPSTLLASGSRGIQRERIPVADVVDSLVESGVTVASIDRAIGLVLAQQDREVARQMVLADLELPADASQIDLQNEIVFRNLQAEVSGTIRDGSLVDSIIGKGRVVQFLSTCKTFSDERESITVDTRGDVSYARYPIHVLDVPLKFGGDTADDTPWYLRWRERPPLTIQEISSPALKSAIRMILMEGFSVEINFFSQLNDSYRGVLKMSFMVSWKRVSRVSCYHIRTREVHDGDLRLLCLS